MSLTPSRRARCSSVRDSGITAMAEVLLLALKSRLALLVERAHALQAVLGDDGGVVSLDGEDHRGIEIGLRAVGDGLLGLAHGDGAVGGDGGRDLQRLGPSLTFGYQMIDQPRGLRLVGLHAPARED